MFAIAALIALTPYFEWNFLGIVLVLLSLQLLGWAIVFMANQNCVLYHSCRQQKQNWLK